MTRWLRSARPSNGSTVLAAPPPTPDASELAPVAAAPVIAAATNNARTAVNFPAEARGFLRIFIFSNVYSEWHRHGCIRLYLFEFPSQRCLQKHKPRCDGPGKDHLEMDGRDRAWQAGARVSMDRLSTDDLDEVMPERKKPIRLCRQSTPRYAHQPPERPSRRTLRLHGTASRSRRNRRDAGTPTRRRCRPSASPTPGHSGRTALIDCSHRRPRFHRPSTREHCTKTLAKHSGQRHDQ